MAEFSCIDKGVPKQVTSVSASASCLRHVVYSSLQNSGLIMFRSHLSTGVCVISLIKSWILGFAVILLWWSCVIWTQSFLVLEGPYRSLLVFTHYSFSADAILPCFVFTIIIIKAVVLKTPNNWAVKVTAFISGFFHEQKVLNNSIYFKQNSYLTLLMSLLSFSSIYCILSP